MGGLLHENAAHARRRMREFRRPAAYLDDEHEVRASWRGCDLACCSGFPIALERRHAVQHFFFDLEAQSRAVSTEIPSAAELRRSQR
ncbi:MAG: hypothetical protein K2Y17_10055 [Qipengyuania sp.]|nr:hypothetical protein [Qipengyuania sp.]